MEILISSLAVSNNFTAGGVKPVDFTRGVFYIFGTELGIARKTSQIFKEGVLKWVRKNLSVISRT